MKINIHALKFDADTKLTVSIEKKLGRLNKFDGIIAADATLLYERAGDEHSGKTTKLRLEVAGSDIFAEHTATTFEEAIDRCILAVKKQLVRRKEKLHGE